jgi:acid phosphatase
MWHKRFALVMFVCLTMAAFAQQPQQQKLAGDAIPNLGEVKAQIRHYYNCDGTNGCYEADLEQQATKAIDFLKQRVATKKPGEKLAMVLDIDETSLSNYAYYSLTDFGYESGRFDMWALSADAPPIRPTLAVFNTARELGVSVFFITGRGDLQRFATEQNLLRAGYKNWEGLTLRAPAEATKKTIDYKSAARKKITDQGYKLVLNIGDQQSDLAGDPQAEMSLKLPNPFYFIP